MGFLMGAYGKLMAGQRMRSIQFRLTTVQSRLRRVTREIGEKEKMYQAQQRNMKNQMQSQMQWYLMGQLNAAAASSPLAAGQLAMMTGGDYAAIQNDPMYQAAMADTTQMQAFSTWYSSMQQRAQMQATMANTMWENAFEMQKEADLNALKDLEDSLMLEKDSLESQLKIAQADYEANKDMEKQGAQNLKPDYTGQA